MRPRPGPGGGDLIGRSSEIRSALIRFLLVGLGSLALVSIPTFLMYREIAQDFTLTLAVENGRNLASRVIAPQTTSAAIAGDRNALLRIDNTARARLADGSVVRIKIWDMNGRLVYSDEPALTGRVYTLDQAASSVNASETTVAEVSPLNDPENEFEWGHKQLVEVYSLAKAVTGEPLIFEFYFPMSTFSHTRDDLLLKMAPVALGALVVLNFAQLPSALGLARRIQRNRESRQRLLVQAVAAADQERRRLAQELHDDVIQDLAGVGYALSSLDEHLDTRNGPDIARIGAIVHRDVKVLRSMVTTLYPGGLDPATLAMSLSDLGNALRRTGVLVEVDVDEKLALDGTTAALVYRVTRESLNNAQKHANPRNVTVRLAGAGAGAVLSVVDDGRGFEPSAEPPAGHFGLKLIRDTVAEAGGTLSVDSGIGRGTRVELGLPGR